MVRKLLIESKQLKNVCQPSAIINPGLKCIEGACLSNLPELERSCITLVFLMG